MPGDRRAGRGGGKNVVNPVKQLMGDARALFDDRQKLYQLMRNDLKARYAGSAFGMAWAFVQPLVSMLVMWAVFQVGFRSAPVDDIEFILWYIAANVPWIFYSDAVNASAGCLYEYNYLVKKMRFKTELLPLVKVLSATVTHTFFMAFSMFMLEAYGYQPQLIWLQILYYSFAAFCLSLGLGWLVAAVSVFFKDFAHMTGIIIGIQFWLTPVLWGPAQMGEKALMVFKLNPMFYVTNGYRDSLIYGVPFWQRPGLTVYFWAVTIALFIAGRLAFKKLSPHFADLI